MSLLYHPRHYLFPPVSLLRSDTRPAGYRRTLCQFFSSDAFMFRARMRESARRRSVCFRISAMACAPTYIAGNTRLCAHLINLHVSVYHNDSLKDVECSFHGAWHGVSFNNIINFMLKVSGVLTSPSIVCIIIQEFQLTLSSNNKLNTVLHATGMLPF